MGRKRLGLAACGSALICQAVSGGYRVGIAYSGKAEGIEKLESALHRALENGDFGVSARILGPLTEPQVDQETAGLPGASLCEVDFDVTPEQAVVTLDGLSLGNRRHFQFLSGRKIVALVTAPGFRPREREFDCRQASQWVESVYLERGEGPAPALMNSLRRMAQSSKVDSVLLVQILPSYPRLFLYTAGVGTDPLPMEWPRASGNSWDPVPEVILDRQLFQEVLIKHNPAFLSQHEAGRTQGVPAGEKRSWYRRPGFWLVAGGVAVGIAIAAVAGRRDPANPGAHRFVLKWD